MDIEKTILHVFYWIKRNEGNIFASKQVKSKSIHHFYAGV